MKDTIHLPIEKKWFDMILSGEEKEEYREIKPYYSNRFIGPNTNDYPVPKGRYLPTAKTITLTNGYGNHRPRIVIEWNGLEVNFPKSEWCPPETSGLWYVLKLGRILQRFNLEG